MLFLNLDLRRRSDAGSGVLTPPFARRSLLDAHRLHGVLRGLEDLHGVPVQPQAGSRLRYRLQIVQDQPIQGLGSPGGKVPAQGPIEVPHPDAAVDGPDGLSQFP